MPSNYLDPNDCNHLRLPPIRSDETSKGSCVGVWSYLAVTGRGILYAADKLVADYGGLSGFQSAVWVAKDLKIFDKHGLDVEVIMITGAARSVAALLGNSTQFSTGSATGPLAAAVRGSDIKVIAASYNKFPYAFVVRPDIRTRRICAARGSTFSISAAPTTSPCNWR